MTADFTLDAAARLPSAEEINAFASDPSNDRRQKVIARLLQDDRHASLWATRLCDMTRCATDLMEGPANLQLKRARMWHDWFRTRFRDNVPYDQIVRGVLCGASLGERSYATWIEQEAKLLEDARQGFTTDYAEREFLDLFWRRVDPEGVYPRREIAEITSAAFLGMQLECAHVTSIPTIAGRRLIIEAMSMSFHKSVLKARRH